jgi:phosphoribosyl 1,2-cyclic phosphodiesterase
MLENGRYPFILKERIRNGKGHISNKQALDLFINHRSSFITHLFLSHLSKENNCPELAKNLFLPHANETEIIIASRYIASQVYEISHTQFIPINKTQQNRKDLQLGLFDKE